MQFFRGGGGGETERAKHIIISYKAVRGTKRDLRKLLFLPRSLHAASKTQKHETNENVSTVNRDALVHCAAAISTIVIIARRAPVAANDDVRARVENRARVGVSTGPYRHRGFDERARSVNSVVGFNLHESISSNRNAGALRVRCATTAAFKLLSRRSGRKSREITKTRRQRILQ